MRRTLTSFAFSWVAASLFLFFAASLPLSAQMSAPTPGRGRRFSISGAVRDFDSHNSIEGAKVDLHSLSGGVINTIFTSSTGAFQFDGVGTGNYTLIIAQLGFDQLNQEVTVEGGPIMGLQLDLRRLNQAASTSPNGQGRISARELAIPNKARDAMDKGMHLLYDKSDYNGAVAEFQRALKAYPDYYEAYMQMGIAYMKSGDSSGAEQLVHKALQMNPQYADAYGALALILCNEKRFEDAEPAARKSVELDPDSWQGNYELGRALYGLNRLDEAEPSVQTAIGLHPDDSALYLLLANIHQHLRNYTALIDDLNAYLKLDPNGEEAEQAKQIIEKVQQALARGQATPAAPAQPPTPQP